MIFSSTYKNKITLEKEKIAFRAACSPPKVKTDVRFMVAYLKCRNNAPKVLKIQAMVQKQNVAKLVHVLKNAALWNIFNFG